MYRNSLAGLLVAGLASLCGTAISQNAPDLILHNAIVWTVDDNNPRSEAVAITGDRLVAVGSDEEVLRLRGSQTRVIDLQGNLMVPGFNDNHVHFSSAASFHEFNIMAVGTQEEFVERVRAAVQRVPEGEWITGGMWGAYDQWAIGSAGGEAREPFRPDMSLIEDITANHPMSIRKFDNSEYAVNKAALRAAGLDPENPQAQGSVFIQDATGRPTGIFTGGGARRLFGGDRGGRGQRGRGQRGRGGQTGINPRQIAQTRHALQLVAEAGVTSLSDMSGNLPGNTQLAIYRQLREAGELTVRVHYRPGLETWEQLQAQGIRIGSGDEWIRFGAVKGHIDGIMGASSARFFEPYNHDQDNRGRWRPLMVDDDGNFVEGKFLGYMLGADAAGLQLTVHAIGDEANHLLMNYLEDLNETNGQRDRRFRLVHAQVIAADDMQRLNDLGIVAEVQPFHLSDDMRWMEERIGHERCRGAYAFKTINDNTVLSFGTDWPGTGSAEYPINPMLGIYAAVTRKTITGEPEEGWFPDEKISVEDAIKAYTWGTAYASFEEDIKGTIITGKLADLTVLDHNILECDPMEFLDTKALYTIVGGRIVFQR